MLQKLTYSTLLTLFVFQIGIAQKVTWSVQAETHLNFLSLKNPVTNLQISGFDVFFANGTAYANPTVSYELETLTESNFGYGATLKMGILLSERWTYNIGLGLQMKSVDLAYQSTTYLYDNNINNGAPPILVNFPGVQTDDIHFTNFGAYYASAQQELLYQQSTFWHAQFIPLEIDYQLIKNRLSLFLNGQFLPVLDDKQSYNNADFEVNNSFRFNRLQIGAAAGLSVQLFKKWTIQTAYFRGLTNLHNTSTINLESNWNGVSLGVRYGN